MTSERTGNAPRVRPAFFGLLGAGLIAGAAGNDPAGIATYSQAGARFHFELAWILLLTYPLIVGVQTVSARLGRTTGRGIAGNLRRRFPAWFTLGIVVLLVFANLLNIGADLQGMAEAVRLLLPQVPEWLSIVLLGGTCLLGPLLLAHGRYMHLLKWLALAPLSYLVVLAVIRVPWPAVADGLLRPRWSSESAFWLMVVAMLGTTISPYLFFWQSAQEVEDTRADPLGTPLAQDPANRAGAFARIRLDTVVGMGISNLVGLAILLTAGATLPQAGIHDVASAAEAAVALRPVAGSFAFALFALGVIGSGVLCVQVMAGSAAYALSEALGRPAALARGARPARGAFRIVLTATVIALVASWASINAIHALVWSGIVNAVVAVPAMAALMLMAGDARLTGSVRLGRLWRSLGWVATAVMALATAGWAWSVL